MYLQHKYCSIPVENLGKSPSLNVAFSFFICRMGINWLNPTSLGYEDLGKRRERHGVYCAAYFSRYASLDLFKSTTRRGASLPGMWIHLLTAQVPSPEPTRCLHRRPPIVVSTQGCGRKSWLCDPQPTCFLTPLC